MITTAEDNDLLIRCINELFGHSFIVNEYPYDAKWYRFLSRGHIQDARERLQAVGFDLDFDADAEVIRLVRDPSCERMGLERLNRKQFKAEHIKVLLVIMMAYWSTISIDATKNITFGRFNDSVDAVFPAIPAGVRKEALKLFKTFKLVYFNVSSEKFEEDTVITMFHSIAFCMTTDQFKTVIEDLKSKVCGQPPEENDATEEDDFIDDEWEEEEE